MAFGGKVGAAGLNNPVPDRRRHVGAAAFAGEAGINQDDDVGIFIDHAAIMPGEFGLAVGEPALKRGVREKFRGIDDHAPAKGDIHVLSPDG